MKLFLDTFDTEIFKRNVYKLYLDKDISSEVVKSILEIKKGIIFCFTVFSRKNFNLLQKNGFNLISIRNTYKLDLVQYVKKNVGNIPEGYEILDRSRSIKLLQENDLTQIAKTIYETSRYSKDKSLEKNKSFGIYTSWVSNSLYNNYVDEAFLAFNKLTALGIITIKIDNKTGSIDLLGIIKKFQNQKLATHLLRKAIDYLRSHHIDDIFVTTEGENIPANIFYQRNHFLLTNIELVYHKNIV